MSCERIKVLLVDDEYLERELLKNCIDWTSAGMEISGEAQDTEEAMQQIEQYSPDVIFTDIQMPGSDGICLSEQVLRKHPGIKIVVITGYDNFEYAQRSIKAGISDYLLKPIDGDEVLKTVSGIREQINLQKEKDAETLALKKQFSDSLPYLRERFFNELLFGSAYGDSMRERMALLGIRFRSGFFQAAAFEAIAENGSENEESRFLLSLQISNSLKEYFSGHDGVYVFMNTTNRTVVLNSEDSLDLYEQCGILRNKLIKGLSCSVCVGVGGLKHGADKIGGSYREALEALRYRIAVGNDAVILYDSIRLPEREPPCDWNELYGQLDFYIRTGLTDKVDETVDKILGNIDLQEDRAVEAIRIAAMNTALAFFRSLTEAGLDADEIYRFEVTTNKRIFSLGTLPEIKGLFRKAARECIDSISRHQSSRVGSLFGEIRQYVEEHYQNSELNLTELARAFFFNPSYLSRMFKKKAGVSFTDFLMGVRMEKAVGLLQKKNMKSFEIAAEVGIPDPNYFSTCFKKYTGVSVRDFRKSLSDKKTAC